ncbi:MAG TPA: hypothetical protein VH419_07845 [Nocardioidaceae bacterium]
MSLFEHYKATPASVLGQREAALSSVQQLTGIRDDVRRQHEKAMGGILGSLLGAVATTFDPAYQDAEQMARLKLISSASLLEWASDITHYDTAIDGLNERWERASATSFGVDADQYWMHGADIPAAERQRRFDTAVSNARAALLAQLRREKQTLDAGLDDHADEAKAILNKDPSDTTLQSLFQAGLFPLQISLLFPSIDIGKVDIAKLIDNLKEHGLLPSSTDTRNIANLWRIISDGADDPDAFQDAYPELRNGLAAASPDGLAFIFSLLTPDQIRRFDQRLTHGVDGLDDSQFYRLDIYAPILSKLPPDLVTKLVGSVATLNPGFDHTDGYLDGNAPQRSDGTDGWHWGDPTGPLFADDDDGDPTNDYLNIQQGGLGDCWMITNMIASTLKNPSFPTDHVAANPNGTITVTLYDHQGVAHQVTVTNQIVLDGNGHSALAHSSDGSTWATYYEKAMALAYGDDDGGAPDGHGGDDTYDRVDNGNYAGLEWDYARNAAPYVSDYGGEEIDTNYDTVHHAFVDENHPVMVATKSDDTGLPDDLEDSYHTRHVYYVKGFEDGRIILGNPWGPGYPDVRATPEEFEDWFQQASTID